MHRMSTRDVREMQQVSQDLLLWALRRLGKDARQLSNFSTARELSDSAFWMRLLFARRSTSREPASEAAAIGLCSVRADATVVL
jgi:hypothetical protein